MTRAALPFALLVLVLPACDQPTTDCTLELHYDVTPPSADIVVGGAFTGTMRLSSCGGREHLTDVFAWRSISPQIASVDSLTGRVVGQAPGQAIVTVHARYYGVDGWIPVTVRTP